VFGIKEAFYMVEYSSNGFPHPFVRLLSSPHEEKAQKCGEEINFHQNEIFLE